MITKSKVTIRDVVKEAGVSPATVSGVLNNGGKQNHETINRVSKAIEQLGYTPRRNKLRKQNKRKRQTEKQFALLFPDADDQGMNTPLAHALMDSAEGNCAPIGSRTI